MKWMVVQKHFTAKVVDSTTFAVKYVYTTIHFLYCSTSGRAISKTKSHFKVCPIAYNEWACSGLVMKRAYKGGDGEGAARGEGRRADWS